MLGAVDKTKEPEVRPVLSIKEQVRDMPAKDRANVKGDAILSKTRWTTYTEGEYTIQIESIEKIEGGVQVFARAWKDGKPLGFGSDGTVEIERFRFLNPPVLVPDGTYHTELVQIGTRTEETQVSNFVEDPERALQLALAHTISVSAKDGSKIQAGKRGNTTSTFYPDANVESTSVDGYVWYEFPGGSPGSFTSLRTQATGGTPNDNGTLMLAAVQGSSPNWGSMFRAIMVFDTSSIPDGDAVSSATLSFYGRSGSDQSCGDTAQTRMNITSASTASNTALAAGDYNITGFGSTDMRDTDWTFAAFTSGAYNDSTLNATGIANISVSGVSKFAARNTGDIDNSEPTACTANKAAEFRFESADQTGTTQDPKLVVVHAAAATPSFGDFFISDD